MRLLPRKRYLLMARSTAAGIDEIVSYHRYRWQAERNRQKLMTRAHRLRIAVAFSILEQTRERAGSSPYRPRPVPAGS